VEKTLAWTKSALSRIDMDFVSRSVLMVRETVGWLLQNVRKGVVFVMDRMAEVKKHYGIVRRDIDRHQMIDHMKFVEGLFSSMVKRTEQFALGRTVTSLGEKAVGLVEMVSSPWTLVPLMAFIAVLSLENMFTLAFFNISLLSSVGTVVASHLFGENRFVAMTLLRYSHLRTSPRSVVGIMIFENMFVGLVVGLVGSSGLVYYSWMAAYFVLKVLLAIEQENKYVDWGVAVVCGYLVISSPILVLHIPDLVAKVLVSAFSPFFMIYAAVGLVSSFVTLYHPEIIQRVFLGD